MVTSELAALNFFGTELLGVDNRNWKIIEEHVKVFQKNFHALRDSDQLLFSRQLINFNYDTISSLLANTFANIETFRGALYCYRINMLNSYSTESQ